MRQIKGDVTVTDKQTINGQVTGTTYVRAGGSLILAEGGQLSGGLIIEAGGSAEIRGQVARNTVNNGRLTLIGQISGRLLGNQPINAVGPDQIVGIELEVPFRGKTVSWES